MEFAGTPDSGERSCVGGASEAFRRIYGALVQRAAWMLEGSDATEDLRAQIASRGAAAAKSIRYNQMAREFNRSYFLKNLHKCLLVFSHLRSRGLISEGPVVDLGGGAGTALIAWSAVPGLVGESVLIDRSRVQLSIARDTLEAVGIRGVRFGLGDYADFLPPRFAGIRLASYALTSDVDRFARLSADRLRGIVGPGLVVVDYAEVIRRFEKLSGLEPIGRLSLQGVSLPLDRPSLFGGERIKVNAAIFKS